LKSWKDDPRCETNPIFGESKLKLGLFGLNSGDQIKTLAPDRYVADWDRSDAAMGALDELELDIMVSLAGWFHTPELETFTWAAGLGARHSKPAVISTLHVQLFHPVFVARMAATVDQITHGRFGLNLVAGFNPKTFAPFGTKLENHEERYAHAAEFVDLLKRCWTADAPFDHEGKFYTGRNIHLRPQPVQKLPPIMNAGLSGRGRDFACKYADMVFTILEPKLDDAKAQIASYKNHARDEFGREVQVWTHGHIVIRDTEKEAEDFLEYYAGQHADHESIAKWLATLGASAPPNTDPATLARLNRGWAAGSGTRLVGTAEQVADELEKLSDIGLDGIIWNTIEPENLMRFVGRDLLPLLDANGLRKQTRRNEIPLRAVK
jgi:FMNH2-dependent dimethyl sulfone monooxygenase